MVGIQIGREQEEGERAEDAGFEKIEDFNVTSNAEEKFAGATMTSAEDFTFDMTLQLGGEEMCHMWNRMVREVEDGNSKWGTRLKEEGKTFGVNTARC